MAKSDSSPVVSCPFLEKGESHGRLGETGQHEGETTGDESEARSNESESREFSSKLNDYHQRAVKQAESTRGKGEANTAGTYHGFR